MLAALWPEPCVREIAGRAWAFGEFTLRDLAEMERWATGGGTARHWAELEAAAAIVDQAERQARLKTLYDSAESGLESFGSAGIAAKLDTPEGLVVQLRLSLAHVHHGITPDEVLEEVALPMTEADWAWFGRVAWALDPLDATAAEIDREIGVHFVQARPRKVASWPQLVRQLARRTGWTLEQIGDLTLSQWDALWTPAKGKSHPVAEPERPPEGWSWERYDAEISVPRERFWGRD